MNYLINKILNFNFFTKNIYSFFLAFMFILSVFFYKKMVFYFFLSIFYIFILFKFIFFLFFFGFFLDFIFLNLNSFLNIYLYTFVIFLPFLSFIILFFGISKTLGVKSSSYLSVFLIFLTFFVSALIFKDLILMSSKKLDIRFFLWLSSNELDISWGIYLDTVTSVMLIVITSISFLVHLYSCSYMGQDPHLPRFISYLSLFTFFMIILVTGNNFLVMFVGWEGVGLCSYLLINFWYTRVQANKSAIKAIIVNRVGDLGLIIAMSIIFLYFGSLDYSDVFVQAHYLKDDFVSFFGFNVSLISLIGFFIYLGVMGKSAQIGLHTWLPDAMEGPTPVSALIHAATMVTAGVFLLVRVSFLIEYSDFLLSFITISGALTAFFAATTGVFQNDVKKVIAYSTCSQLGYMVFSCGLSGYDIGMFHLFNHAFFKALLFLSAGCVIHALDDEQDMRKMGGLLKLMPFTYICFLIGSLSLTGFPFFSGFYSKDAILMLSYSNYNFFGYFSYLLGSVSAFFTSFYSIRLIYLVFFSEPSGYRSDFNSATDPEGFMRNSLFFLILGSLFSGFIFKDMFIGFGSDFWKNSIFILPEHRSYFLDFEFLPFYIKICPIILSFSGSILSFVIFNYYYLNFINFTYLNNFGRFFYSFLNKKWNIDIIYNFFILKMSLTFGYRIAFKYIDKGFLEYFGPTGFSNFLFNFSSNLSKYHNGFLINNFFFFILGIFFLLSIFFSKIFFFLYF